MVSSVDVVGESQIRGQQRTDCKGCSEQVSHDEVA